MVARTHTCCCCDQHGRGPAPSQRHVMMRVPLHPWRAGVVCEEHLLLPGLRSCSLFCARTWWMVARGRSVGAVRGGLAQVPPRWLSTYGRISSRRPAPKQALAVFCGLWPLIAFHRRHLPLCVSSQVVSNQSKRGQRGGGGSSSNRARRPGGHHTTNSRHTRWQAGRLPPPRGRCMPRPCCSTRHCCIASLLVCRSGSGSGQVRFGPSVPGCASLAPPPLNRCLWRRNNT